MQAVECDVCWSCRSWLVSCLPDQPPDGWHHEQDEAAELRYNNLGAVAVLSSPNWSVPHFLQYEADLPRPAAKPYYDIDIPGTIVVSLQAEKPAMCPGVALMLPEYCLYFPVAESMQMQLCGRAPASARGKRELKASTSPASELTATRCILHPRLKSFGSLAELYY